MKFEIGHERPHYACRRPLCGRHVHYSRIIEKIFVQSILLIFRKWIMDVHFMDADVYFKIKFWRNIIVELHFDDQNIQTPTLILHSLRARIGHARLIPKTLTMKSLTTSGLHCREGGHGRGALPTKSSWSRYVATRNESGSNRSHRTKEVSRRNPREVLLSSCLWSHVTSLRSRQSLSPV